MVRISEDALANVSGGVNNFDSLEKDGKVTTSACAVFGAISLLTFCVAACKKVVKLVK